MKTQFMVTLFCLMPGVVLQLSGQSYVGGAGMMNAGYMYTPELSSSLNSIAGNSTRFQNGYSIVGAEINYRHLRKVFVVSGYIGTQEAKFINDKLVEPFIWKVHGGFGWILNSNKSLSIYPVLGLGAIQSSLTYHQRSDYEIRSVLTAPSIDLSAHFDYFLSKTTPTDEFFEVALISAQVGYCYGLSSSKLQGWTITISFSGVSFLKYKR